jgi:hypothetical protein
MSNPNPGHLLAQAGKLIEYSVAGPPRQVDIRRAISSAYYAVFHAVLIASADTVAGRSNRGTPNYVLVYRSVEHRHLRALCEVASVATVQKRYQLFVPASGFSNDIRRFAGMALKLQENRHMADYNPAGQFRTPDAKAAIANARIALGDLAAAPEAERRTLIMLLLFPPR